MITRLTPVQLLLTVLTVVGLAVDAYVHFDVAPNYDANATTTMSEGDLFRLEATIAIVVAVALIVIPRWWTAALAGLVGLGGALFVIISVYSNLPAVGPAPEIYKEPWYTEKTVSAVFEIIAFLAAVGLVIALRRAPGRAGHRASRPLPGSASH